SVLLVGRDGGLRAGLGGHLALAVGAPGFLMAVPVGAVVLDGVGDGAGAGGRHGDRGVGAVAGLRPGRFQQVVADGGLVVGVDQGPVAVAAAAQLLMGAGVGDAAVVEEDDPVGEGDGRFAVGDQQQSGGGHLAADPVEDRELHAGVAGAGGVVQDQQPRP